MRYGTRIKITQGMSKDKKYMVVGEDGKKYFLRIVEKQSFCKSPIEYYRKANIDIFGDRVVRIIDCVETDDSYECYYEYVDGTVLEQYIGRAKKEEVIDIASRSAVLLKNIQSIDAGDQIDFFNVAYITRELQRCKECIAANKIIEFISDNNKYLLDKNHKSFLHSDYHIGNIILTDKKELVVVDIEKYEYGSFYRDLLINETYNREISSVYAKTFLREYSSQTDFDWMSYNVHMSFYFVRFIIWSKRKRGVTIDEKRINEFFLEHCVNPRKMPDWIE